VTTYVRRHDPVAAIKWTGHNFLEVEQFVRDWIGPDDETGIRNEPGEGWPTERFAYNTVQFTVWTDDCTDDAEVDPDRWIVVHTDFPVGHRERVEVLDDDLFRRDYEPLPAARPARQRE
jgi:hypothetical protein